MPVVPHRFLFRFSFPVREVESSAARKPFLDLEKIAPLPDLGGLDAAAPFATLRRLERGGARLPLGSQRQEDAHLRRSERTVRIGWTAALDRHAQHAIDPPRHPLLPSFRLLARPRELDQGNREERRRQCPSRRSAIGDCSGQGRRPDESRQPAAVRFPGNAQRIRARDLGFRPNACKATTANRTRCSGSTMR